MTRHPLFLPVLLALITIAALVAMFLLDGWWDGLFFVLSMLPLLVGGWRWYAMRGQS